MEILGRSMLGQISRKIRFSDSLYPIQWGIALQEEDAPVPAQILGGSMSGRSPVRYDSLYPSSWGIALQEEGCSGSGADS